MQENFSIKEMPEEDRPEEKMFETRDGSAL